MRSDERHQLPGGESNSSSSLHFKPFIVFNPCQYRYVPLSYVVIYFAGWIVTLAFVKFFFFNPRRLDWRHVFHNQPSFWEVDHGPHFIWYSYLRLQACCVRGNHEISRLVVSDDDDDDDDDDGGGHVIFSWDGGHGLKGDVHLCDRATTRSSGAAAGGTHLVSGQHYIWRGWRLISATFLYW